MWRQGRTCPQRSIPFPSWRLSPDISSRIQPRRLGRCRGARAQHADSHCSSLQVRSPLASGHMSPKPFWGESCLFLLSPYISHGAGSAGSCPIIAASRRSSKVLLLARRRAQGIHQKRFSSCKTSVPSWEHFGVFHPSPRNEKPFYLPERNRLLPHCAVGQLDLSRCVIHPSGKHHPFSTAFFLIKSSIPYLGQKKQPRAGLSGLRSRQDEKMRACGGGERLDHR